MTQRIQPTITDERLDGLILQLLTERAESVAASSLPAETVADRMATRLRPSPYGRTWIVLAAALLLVAMLIGGAIASGAIRPPWIPTPAPIERSWTGPVRTDSAAFPVIAMEPVVEDRYMWTDGPDGSAPLVDIDLVETGGGRRLQWNLSLGDVPSTESSPNGDERITEYGLVLDDDGDGVANCHIGINDDTPVPGDYRVWVTNLETGVTQEQVGGPYGIPIDFAHPGEFRPGDYPPGTAPQMRFFFLGSAAPCDLGLEPVRFYAYATVKEQGRVVSWDYAPDAAWLGRRAE